jgi:hypothetical protein
VRLKADVLHTQLLPFDFDISSEELVAQATAPLDMLRDVGNAKLACNIMWQDTCHITPSKICCRLPKIRRAVRIFTKTNPQIFSLLKSSVASLDSEQDLRPMSLSGAKAQPEADPPLATTGLYLTSPSIRSKSFDRSKRFKRLERLNPV